MLKYSFIESNIKTTERQLNYCIISAGSLF